MNRFWFVALLYLGITVAMTWPIAARIDRAIPSDLGDPAFVAGVMAWGAEHWLSFLTGDLSAATRVWDAPIFFPETSALAYSEHFALQSLMTLPAYVLTRNPVVCYNLAFLSTFVIGALGMYLLVRELTGAHDGFNGAAFVAGLAFAFAPYRVATMPHLQVLSSQWMPFVLLGIHRYFRLQNTDGLVIAGAALWAQNLSSGYYMLFFTPFVVLFSLVQIGARRLWRQAAVWLHLAAMFVVTFIATLPFALPYIDRTRGTRRAIMEVAGFSADIKAWATASPWLHVWGDLQALNKGEGYLFPGITVVILAVLGISAAWKHWRHLAWFGGLTLFLSVWLALGPDVLYDTRPTGIPSLYQLLWYLPGYSAARVPARFATITILALALLAGIALTRLGSRARWVVVVSGVLILAEGSAFPLPTNGAWTSAPGETHPPEARLYSLAEAPAVYRYLDRLQRDVVVVHFPFGLPEREIQYGYYAMLNGRSTVNGYSGAFPPTYNMRLQLLRNPAADLESLRLVLQVDRITHAVVHTGAYVRDGGAQVIDALQALGWREVTRFGDDVVMAP